MGMICNFLSVPLETVQFLKDNPTEVASLLYTEEERSEGVHYLDLDKAWHGIHFLLTGDAWRGRPPLSSAILGGIPVSEEDVGYGPVRYLTPDEVKRVNAALGQVSRESLVSRFSPQAFEAASIYPTGVWDREGAAALEYALFYFDKLVAFYADASSRGDAMLLYLN